MAGSLKINEVREYVSDYANENFLLDDQEFSDTFINLSMELAASEYNVLPPRTNYGVENFPSKSLLMMGTLWQMYLGKSTLKARNHMTYTDGGLQIPLEEKYELYKNLADSFRAQFIEAAARLKASANMEAGWGEVRSDEASFPYW
jgi:hypothetical protein